MKLSKLLAVAMLCLSLAPSAKAEDTLRIGTEGAYPPFNFVDAAGTIGGFDVDIGMALCDKMKVKCSVVAQDWDGIIPALQNGKYDVIIASMFITEERKKLVNFTDPYYKAAMTHVVPKGSAIKAFTNDALKGKAIGAQTSTTQADYIQKTYPDADIRLYRTQDEVNLDLANGRLDMQVGDMVPMLEWTLKTDDGKCCDLAGEPITDPKFVGDGVGMAVRKEDTTLLANLNKALAEIVTDGIYKKINDKYFAIDIYTMKKQ
jgi:polar amino acid transport system substrate-binding protein